jgi:hypothetical protein
MAKINYYLKRPIENISYLAGKMFFNQIFRNYFEIKLKGEQNLPKKSSVLCFNHCIGIDGLLFSTYSRKKTHFLVQFEGAYSSNVFVEALLWAIGSIPVKIEDSRFDMAPIRRSKDYLEANNDNVGVFIDGPAKYLREKSGRIVPLDERPSNEGAALISLWSGRPLVPIGLHSEWGIVENLFEFGWSKKEEKMSFIKKYVERSGRIPYVINIGRPIESLCRNMGKNGQRKELTSIVKQEIIRLSKES